MYNNRKTKPIHYLEDTSSKYPDNICIKDIDSELTYNQILHTSRRLGYYINCKIKCIKQPIVVFIDKGCECLTAILSIQYSGNIYVPMDIKTPIDRLQSIMETIQSSYIIANQKSYEILKKIGYDGDVLLFDSLIKNALEDNVASYDIYECLEEIDRNVIDTDIMYILFTSGSTGVPKGVAIAYRSVVDYIESFIREVPISADDVIGNQVPFYVDMSLKDIYMSIAVGASICVIPQKFFMTPKKVLQYIEDNNVTMLMWVPTAYGIIKQFNGLSKYKPSKLNKIMFSGEGMPIAVFHYWYDMYPDALWIQLYGPTEITGACTLFIVDRRYSENETIPIGKPFYNTGVLLLDENDNEITKDMIDIPGEICVFGSCLAMGYYYNSEKTQESFVQVPSIHSHESKMYRTGDLGKWDEKGNLVFISRKDFQIKHGGRRIELGEIEAAVYSIEGIETCCCVHNEVKDEIILIYVGEYDEKQIRTLVRNKIPPYMVPAKYVKLDDLPKLPNGKLDRKGMKNMVVGDHD